MHRAGWYLLLAALAVLVSCGTTNSASMYDPNAPVNAIDISALGKVDPSARNIALPAGTDELLSALRSGLSADGWEVSDSTTNTRYMLSLQTKEWKAEQTLSYIHLSVMDQKTGVEILTGERKMLSPSDPPIDITAVANAVVSSLKKITSSSSE